jgi:hypothetical protein
VINNGLDLMGVSSYYQAVIKGVIIVGAVWLDRRQARSVKTEDAPHPTLRRRVLPGRLRPVAYLPFRLKKAEPRKEGEILIGFSSRDLSAEYTAKLSEAIVAYATDGTRREGREWSSATPVRRPEAV